MSDDEAPEAPAAEEAPPRRKKRVRPAESTPAERSPVPAASTAKASRWTTGHVAAALALGVALGGVGGFLIAKNAGPSATAEGSNKAAGKGQPAAGAYVPLAAWTPREGPELAKVTIVEFSDFQ